MSEAEKKLWAMLRGHQLAGHGFRRQVPMGDYIVDFVCHDKRLVVEADGGQHGSNEAIVADRRRTKWLQSRGYRALRFWNNDILQNPEGIFAVLMAELERVPPSQPSPARGEG